MTSLQVARSILSHARIANQRSQSRSLALSKRTSSHDSLNSAFPTTCKHDPTILKQTSLSDQDDGEVCEYGHHVNPFESTLNRVLEMQKLGKDHESDSGLDEMHSAVHRMTSSSLPYQEFEEEITMSLQDDELEGVHVIEPETGSNGENCSICGRMEGYSCDMCENGLVVTAFIKQMGSRTPPSNFLR